MYKKRRYDPDWNFKEGSMNELNHQIHPYPAMLMPLIVRELLGIYGNGKDTVVLDPYVGSGTTLVEAQFYGAKKVIGVDLNPLAILLSTAKTSKYNFVEIKKYIDDFIVYKDNIDYSIDINQKDVYNFSIRDSWFKEKNVIELAYIQKFIKDIDEENTRMFFNLCFSVVIRSVSMTRNGEFKLYRMPKKRLETFNPDAIDEFIKMLDRNFAIAQNYSNLIDYSTNVEIYDMNSMEINNIQELKKSVDLVITSPPYGDSHTTVAYGQFSRLANEWLEFEEPRSVDNNLMGGSVKVDLDTIFDITELDETIEKIKKFDETQKNKRYPDVISFYIDYIKSIESVVETMKDNSTAIYVVGNRRVRNFELPTDIVTAKTFERLGFEHVETIVRDILNKRMPSKASPSNRSGGQISTMSKEYIVIMKRKK